MCFANKNIMSEDIKQSQSGSPESPLEQINSLLSKANRDSISSKELTLSIGSCFRALESQSLSDEEFSKFLLNIHDYIVLKDSAIRSSLLRAVRYGAKSAQSCNFIAEHVRKIFLLDV